MATFYQLVASCFVAAANAEEEENEAGNYDGYFLTNLFCCIYYCGGEK